MEKLKRAVNQIAYAPSFSSLPKLHRSLIPILASASCLYRLALCVRRNLYGYNVFQQQRLPVAVISVGNLTWGGNGKTPMVEFLGRLFADSGISPLILNRGYGGGDEASMLGRHLAGKCVKIGVGANRAATANVVLNRFGFLESSGGMCFERLGADWKEGGEFGSDRIGVAILDDGMQHLSLWRDLDIVIINAMMPWGNHHLIPLGPLREPMTALRRADIAVIHHANMVPEQDVKNLELAIYKLKDMLPIFLTAMVPSHYFEVGNPTCSLPLKVVNNAFVLCVSAIGSATSFVRAVEKMNPHHVDRLDFSDHHIFQKKDIDMIKLKMVELEQKFTSCPVIVVTEKDYDRDPEILTQMDPYRVLVLCSHLQILPSKGKDIGSFTTLLKKLLTERNPSHLQ